MLSIAAARLGFDPIRAVDNDPVAVETTIANAAVNGVVLEATVLDGESDELPTRGRRGRERAARGRSRRSSRGSTTRFAITSGYLTGDMPAAPGWRHLERVELDGWAADRFERSA